MKNEIENMIKQKKQQNNKTVAINNIISQALKQHRHDIAGIEIDNENENEDDDEEFV